MNKPLTIFGREPAVIVATFTAALAVLLAFGLGISPDSYGPWVALVAAAGGIITAIGTTDTLLGAIVALLNAGFILVAVYGLTLTDQQTAAVVALVPVLAAMWHRTQTSPLVAPAPVRAVPA